MHNSGFLHPISSFHSNSFGGKEGDIEEGRVARRKFRGKETNQWEEEEETKWERVRRWWHIHTKSLCKEEGWWGFPYEKDEG